MKLNEKEEFVSPFVFVILMTYMVCTRLNILLNPKKRFLFYYNEARKQMVHTSDARICYIRARRNALGSQTALLFSLVVFKTSKYCGQISIVLYEVV